MTFPPSTCVTVHAPLPHYTGRVPSRVEKALAKQGKEGGVALSLGEKLAEDEFGWFGAPSLAWNTREPLRLATLAPPCGVRALAIRALDKAAIAWSEAFVGGGVTAVVAAALAGLAAAPLARRIASPGLVDIGPRLGLPSLGASGVMLHSKVSDPSKLAALRTLAATFRRAVKAG